MEEIKLSIKIGTFPRLKDMKLRICRGIIWDHLLWRKYSTKAHSYKSSKHWRQTDKESSKNFKKKTNCLIIKKDPNFTNFSRARVEAKRKYLNFERKLFIYQYYMPTETTSWIRSIKMFLNIWRPKIFRS